MDSQPPNLTAQHESSEQGRFLRLNLYEGATIPSGADEQNLHKSIDLFKHTPHHPSSGTTHHPGKHTKGEFCHTCYAPSMDLECWDPARHKETLRKQPWLRNKEEGDLASIAARPRDMYERPRMSFGPTTTDSSSCNYDESGEECSSDESHNRQGNIAGQTCGLEHTSRDKRREHAMNSDNGSTDLGEDSDIQSNRDEALDGIKDRVVETLADSRQRFPRESD